jgi:hypothetical protein
MPDALVDVLADDLEVGELNFVLGWASAEAVGTLFMPHLRKRGRFLRTATITCSPLQ